MNSLRSARQKKLSRKQEKAVAEALGGRTQAASGATRLGGGADVRARGCRIECKYTEKDSYTLKRADLQKLKKQAARTLEQPVMQVAFLDIYGRREAFAITKTTWGNTRSIKAKSTIIYRDWLWLHKGGIRIRFGDDPEGWLIRHWDDFKAELDAND
jgi:hypothetical protein